jgi:hypothetical protein
MLIISSRAFRDSQKKYFDLAKRERVIIKRKNEFMELVPRGNVIPDNPSPSNDLWFNDPVNIEALDRSIVQAKEGKVIRISGKDELKAFLDNL